MKMTELCSDWLFGYYALGRGKFSSKNISVNNFSSERIDSKGLYGSWRLRVMGSWRVWLQTGLDDTKSYYQLIIKIKISEKRRIPKLWKKGKICIKVQTKVDEDILRPHGFEAFRTNFYIWCCFLCTQVLWGLRDKINFKSLQFLPESLGAMLEYWYIELGLLGAKNTETSARTQTTTALNVIGWFKDVGAKIF